MATKKQNSTEQARPAIPQGVPTSRPAGVHPAIRRPTPQAVVAPAVPPRSVTLVPREVKSVSDLPEVAEYEALEIMYERFKREHADVFERFTELANRRNAALALADKAVRLAQVECGSFIFAQSPRVGIKAEELYDDVGFRQFIDMGGQIETAKKYTMDPAALDKAVAEGRLSPEDAKRYVKVTYVYKSHKVVTT